MATAVAVLALSGCGRLMPSSGGEPADNATVAAATSSPPAPTPASTGTPTPRPSVGGSAGLSVKDSGDIPDVCALLSKAEVNRLTGQRVTQLDADGGQPGDISRYCQWQLGGGQLAVFLSRTTRAEFEVKNAAAEPVSGVGQDAYSLAGHLMVLYGTVMVDVYARGGSDAENLDVAKQVVRTLLPKI